jgi:GT2 family glycosyltransferase/glycosyltransferase involved in cell wall biosynthesis
MTLTASEQEAGLARMLAGFFDSAWYASRYPDVVTSQIEPLLHFIRFGAGERRDPNRFFDSAWYMEHYPDVQMTGIHPLLHYLSSGAAELRNPHPRFDAVWYVDQYPDSVANPLLYHIRVGQERGNLTEKPLSIGDYLPSDKPPFDAPRGRVVDVVIPVYKGLIETRSCLNAVLASEDCVRGEVIVIDDRSPEPELGAWLDTLAASGRIRLVRNRRNMGFVHSVNAGMAAAGDHDVVLLNSDTEVPDGWLTRLAALAYAEPRIATVSPLSNNATICSYPADAGGPIVFGRTADEIDALCRKVNAGRSVATPTAVGFCMYIRRAALNEVGAFDAERFGVGYGEENDFCLRATSLGWHHRIACDTFVYHAGSVSFGARIRGLTKRATGLLVQRYPHYPRDIALHVNLDAIGPFRWALTGAVLKSTGLPVLLMVSHDLGGGVRRHIDALIVALDGKAHVLMLDCGTRGASLSAPALAGHPVLHLPSERLDDLVKVLRHCGVTRVHVHHLLGMDLDVRAMIRRLGVPFDLTVHDYHAICPQVVLLPSPTQLYCNEPAAAACNACIAARPSHGARDIVSWRAERAWQFHEAERVYCPSRDVLTRLERFGLAKNAVFVPHEPIGEGPWPVAAVAPGGKLRIAVLGVLADHKGARTVAALAEASDPATIEIHLIGHTEASFPKPALKRMKVTGAYQEAALPGLIASVAPHIIWFPSSCPETFSYTLSAAIASGRPIAASDIGSFTERLSGRPFTWLADHRSSAAEWLDLFERIRTELPARPVTTTAAIRGKIGDVYATHYLRRDRAARPTRRRGGMARPVVVVLPERYATGQPTPCAYIRLLQPLDHPGIGGDFEVRVADTTSVMDIDADIIATQRYALPDAKAVDALAAHARKIGATLLYDLDDDLLNIGRNHPEAERLRPKAPIIRRILAAADAVWVSTRVLADSIADVAANVTIVPNGLDERIWATSPPHVPPAAGPARLLCMGTTTHERDFAMIAPALVRLKQEFGNDIEIDLLGMTGSPDIPPEINRIGVPLHATLSYPGFVHWLTSVWPGWHIGLAPLLDTPFNRAKSPIKVMDYAALGLAVLASDIPVYRGSLAGGPAGQLVANDPRAWHAALSWLVRNRSLRLGMAAEARPGLLAASSLAVQAGARRDAWKQLLRKAPSEAPAAVYHK